MSVLGFMMCKTCRHVLQLGKLLHDDGPDGGPSGFGNAQLEDDTLGKVVLAFDALHLGHDVVLLSDSQYADMKDIEEYWSLTMVDPHSAIAQVTPTVRLGGITFNLCPNSSERTADLVRSRGKAIGEG
ncbi:MAG: hypothetical protein A3K18_25750 [Lentisphaerae bacterium RIFOXYA12_64_32]|nr:MAG: hypothetical protein A3K18_25750 [Lentisphaerae bacterium RIFOXYA12_64_32]